MSNPTTPFSWQMPTATDLVTDLPADFEVFGQAVATSMADLLGGTTGQVLSKTTDADMDFTWVAANPGDITAVTAGTGISGGGTSGAVTITNSMATEITAKGDLIVGTGSATFDNLAAGADGSTIVADSSTSSGLRWQGTYAAGKNAIINGAFNVWQRGTSFSAQGYLADRFRTQFNGSGATRTMSQQTFTPGTAPVTGYESQYFFRYDQSVAGTGGSYNTFEQYIEDVRTFANQTATFSFWAKASSSVTITGQLSQNFGSGGSATVDVTAQNAALTTSWQRFTLTFSVPSVSGKTIGTGSALRAILNLPLNTTYTIDTWGWQLEAGSVATAFQTATGTLQGELAACQTYYFRFGGSANYQYYGTGVGASSTVASIQIFSPTTMRTSPTSIDLSTLGLSDSVGGIISVSSVTADVLAPNLQSVAVNVASGLTQYRFYRLFSNNSTSAYIGFSAEL